MVKKEIYVKDKWCLHSYYTLCPYSPDGSGNILVSGADLDSNTGEIYIISKEGEILSVFGKHSVESSFYHTGYWQTWSPDAKYVYYQSGTHINPSITRYEVETGDETTIKGDMEGAPPFGEPIYGCNMGMLYAAGYANGNYEPEKSSIAFENRDKHGIFRYSFGNRNKISSSPILSTQDILDIHPDKDKILYYDNKLKHIGGLTLMLYCIRWNEDGSRLLFYFGNHSVDKKRGEPKLSYVFTANKDFKQIKLAVDMSFGKNGVHWSWQKDNENLIGYGTDFATKKLCLMESSADGKHKRMINEHDSGGHPSTSPKDNNIIVTDEFSTESVVLFDKETGKELDRIKSNNRYGNNIPVGRNQYRVCHHPVFNRDGTKILFNTMDSKCAKLMEVEI